VAKRTTKRDVILEGIDKEIASVKADIASAEAEMAIHRGNLSSLYAVEHALEKLRRQTAESLAPQPRRATTKSNGGIARASKDSPSRGKGQCAHEYPDNRFCGQPDTDPIHAEDNDDVFAHAFIASGARKKSSPKKQARLPVGCVATLPSNDEVCGAFEDNVLLHYDKGYADYHSFVKPATPRRGPTCSQCGTDINDNSHINNALADFHPFVSSIPADSAQPPSSANGGENSSILNSVDETVSEGVAAGGSSD